MKLLIDTDMGVDDAIAVACVLAQTRYSVEVVGLSAVAGNTTVDHVINNILTLLDVLERADIPVAQGADKPLTHPLSRAGETVHGHDGLWSQGIPHARRADRPFRDIVAFYQRMVDLHADVSLVTLGPLTNLALVLRAQPDLLHHFKQIFVLGGSKQGGNRSPIAEYNMWVDPEAAQIVLNAHLPLVFVPLDIFNQFTLDEEFLTKLPTHGSPVGRWLAAPLRTYAECQRGWGAVLPSCPDPVTLLCALDPSLYISEPALIDIVPDGAARGLTIIGISPIQRALMRLPDHDLSGFVSQFSVRPDSPIFGHIEQFAERAGTNAHIVTSIDLERMQQVFKTAFISA